MAVKIVDRPAALAVLLIVALATVQVRGQGDRGGPGRGGFRGGPGGGFGSGRGGFGPGRDGGFFRGGGPPGRGGFFRGGGGPGGGPPGRGPYGSGGSSGGISDFIRRLDENGDGVLSPEESQGRASFFVRRFMPNADTSRPIPIEALARAFEQYRQERMRQYEASRSSDGGDSRGSGSSSAAALEPLVPGFDVQLDLPPVPGFGNMADYFALTVTERDREEAQRTLRRYDENRDGQLDRREASRGRWSSDPYQFDRNGDGILTLNELAMRYARRRLDREGSSGSSGSRSSGFVSRSGSLRRDDDRGRSRGEDRDRSGSSRRSGSSAASARRSYRIKSPYERLPSDLPEWFRQKDADMDGQVMMFEYATSWTDALVQEFARLDANGDGVITPQECLAAKAEGTTVSTAAASTGSGTSTGSGSTGGASASSTSPSATTASSSTASSSIPSAYMKYASGIIKKYDNNGDGVLTADEWKDMSRSPEPADKDHNGRITAEEYALWVMKR